MLGGHVCHKALVPFILQLAEGRWEPFQLPSSSAQPLSFL